MDNNTLLAKTDKGREALAARSPELGPKLRTVLIMVDGKKSVAELGKFIGVTMSLDFFKERPDAITHFNAIQPWRVMRDGSVQNAIFA